MPRTSAAWEKKQEAAIKKAEDKLVKAAAKAGGEKIYTGDNLNYDQYERMGSDFASQLDTPEECKTCEKKGLYKYRGDSDSEAKKICLDPACHRRKKTKKTKDMNKIRKEQDISLTEKLGDIYPTAAQNPTASMRIITRQVMSQLDADEKRDIVKLFEVPTLSNGRLDVDKMNAKLATMEIDDLMHLAIASVITHRRRGDAPWSSNHNYSTRLSKDLRQDIAILTGKMTEFERDEKAFQDAQCKSCSWANEELVGTGKECCGYTNYGKRITEEGKCSVRMAKKKEKAPPKAKPLAEVMTENTEEKVEA